MNNYKRREFIKLSALGFAGIALQFNAISAYAQEANGYLGKWDANTKLYWDAFLERLSKLAKTQYDLPWDQKQYTRKILKQIGTMSMKRVFTKTRRICLKPNMNINKL